MALIGCRLHGRGSVSFGSGGAIAQQRGLGKFLEIRQDLLHGDARIANAKEPAFEISPARKRRIASVFPRNPERLRVRCSTSPTASEIPCSICSRIGPKTLRTDWRAAGSALMAFTACSTS